MHESIIQALNQCHRIGVISHFRPDGDAIGSTIAMALAMQQLGKRVYAWNADTVPERYSFLEGAELITPFPDILPDGLEAIICLDTGDWKRLGDQASAQLNGFPLIINIDHHATNSGYGHINLVQGGTAACGYILFHLFQKMGVNLTPAIASALYTAISTDTGSFQYGSTTPDVMRATAALMEHGIDIQHINRLLYQELSLSTILVHREVLNHMSVEEQGAISHYSIDCATKARLGIGLEDTKDLVDIIRVVRGVRVAAIFEELEDGRIRISLRSKDPAIDVSRIAARFGGGGHAMASGIRMSGTLAECRSRVLDSIRHSLHTPN